MFTLGPLGFAAPAILTALVVLPVLWLILRAVPPAPIRQRFPGVALLLGLGEDETQSDRTPWWLLLLRVLAAALIILAFAGPVLNPQDKRAGSGPLLILADATWADARDWPRRLDRMEALAEEAGQAGRSVAVALSTDLPPDGPEFLASEAWASRLPGLSPSPWAPEPSALAEWAEAPEEAWETYWLSDGLAREGREDALQALERKGAVTVFESPRPIHALTPARFEDGLVKVDVLRAADGIEATVPVVARGLDPSGTERALARVEATFAPGDTRTEAALSLPAELRNRITRFEIEGARSAGAVALADDSLERREVALIDGSGAREGLELLSPLHYLQQALEPTADLLEGQLTDVIPANPDAIVLADVARLSPAEREALTGWVEGGGLLVRFAGPRLAASDVSRDEEDPLLPVRLRQGGRSVGGAMSWGEPRTLRPFPDGTPFAGLLVPDDVRVSAQVMAQPDPDLPERSIAALDDGTPLVTRKPLGDGQVVLFHVTANAEWSTLPLSGLFVQMLERLAVSTRPSMPDAEDMEGTVWTPEEVLDAFGTLQDAGTMPGIAGEDLVSARPGPDTPPGLYAGEDRQLALNVMAEGDTLAATDWPARIPVEGMSTEAETPLKGLALVLALLLLAVDVVASLLLTGRFGPRGAGRAAALVAGLVLASSLADPAMAQEPAPTPTSEVVLAHVITGDAQVDDTAQAGLRGLSDVLFARTSIEPAAPEAVDLEEDELAFYPFLYWPVSTAQEMPSADAYAKLNTYLRSGGMILFDTRDADLGSGETPEGRKLRQLAAPLDIPPIEPIPEDHVLTRTFYLLQDFPGRHLGRDVWVEASPADAERVDGMPFRNLNDGVTPVVIGGNDWAAAWATDPRGNAIFPVGRGYSGERQREIAYRFGVNLIMHVLTGNYKSDQVHVPALLDRLGQ
ncbi:DUF4159 domain-containing protein [Roseicyclus sp. F158]|uniref:DUF4159 domain-containing protein n=1 Tax=Tropicimonas omnivorans TaxID=3075590 RepID=A0ABU3DDM6_9RHOB|nr:DUF4159 domain-containing protein [Roseicyclus sp. F158]MDT0681820.1 DUF4159 domain-containing protein [Roseicyclus sp. F158]